MVSFRHSDRLPKCLHWYTSSPLKSLDAFLNLIKSNSSQKIRKFNVSVTQHPYFKPNTNFCVSNCYLCKFALLFFFWRGFKVSFKAYAKFYVSNPVLKIWTFHLRVLPLHAILFVNLKGTPSFLYNFRLCLCQFTLHVETLLQFNAWHTERFQGNVKCKSKHYHTEE